MTWKKILLEGDAAVLSDTAPTDADFAVAAQGVATEASRRDHKHDLNEGVVGTLKPVDGTAVNLGTNNAVAHLDHIHALGALVANMDFNQKQAVGLIIHAVATPPNSGTEVEGQIYYDTTVADKHPYIWTV